MRRLISIFAGLLALVGVLAVSVEARRLGGAPVIPATTVTATVLAPSSISLSWGAFGSGTVQYQIMRDGQIIGAQQSGATSFVDGQLTPGTLYQYKVYADNGKNTLTFGGSASATTSPASSVLYLTTFEEGNWPGSSQVVGWRKLGADQEKIGPSTERARAGAKSVKFDFQYSDWGNNAASNRTQIIQAPVETSSTLGEYFWAGLSTYLDSTWEADFSNNNELIWQFHGVTGGPGNWPPPVALYGVVDKLRIQVNTDEGVTFDCENFTAPHPTNNVVTTFDLADHVGQWVDWVIRVKFDYTNGSLDVWRNGVHVTSYTGSTLYECNNQVHETGPVFGPIGPYKWDWGLVSTQVSSRIMFIDEIRIGDSTATCADVKPTGAADCEHP